MLFNTFSFAIFFIVAFFLYWFVANKNLRLQNAFLLLASYFFYAWWDWRFAFLLLGCSAVSCYVGSYLPQCEGGRKKYLLLSGIAIELLVLAYFKYANFFITSLVDLVDLFGIHLHWPTIKIILPLGISFYIFRTIGYMLDVYYGKTKPETDKIIYFTYVAYFPSLVNGPIDRAKLLIPQLNTQRSFDSNQAIDGSRQILWGAFKKIVVADNCGVLANITFADPSQHSASTLLLGVFFYTIQLYADFSGYSDMAIGLSNLLGLRITRNFNFPFFAQNIADYWRRWHISLTSWLTDFVFTPVSIYLRDWGKAGLIVSILFTYLLIGAWHGPNWTFVLFGFLHGCYYIPLIVGGTFNKKKKLSEGIFPSLVEIRNMAGTFLLVMLANIVFRSNSIHDAWNYFGGLFNTSLFVLPYPGGKLAVLCTFFLILITLILEWFARNKQHALENFAENYPVFIRWGSYYIIVFLLFYYSVNSESQQFIYVQF